ncbi:MAG: acyl-CoA thioesterase [Planctomycetes bacterium]|nr:acyl-CoA thioesterase [Planctomycetota bacterium]
MTDDHLKPRREPAIKVSMMPRDTNVHLTIFGGVLLAHIDLAGAVHCRAENCDRVVTISMKEVEFKQPVFVGDVVSFFCSTKRIGRTSITVKVDVWAERFEAPRACVWVTEAEVTYVNVDPQRQPTPIPRADRG